MEHFRVSILGPFWVPSGLPFGTFWGPKSSLTSPRTRLVLQNIILHQIIAGLMKINVFSLRSCVAKWINMAPRGSQETSFVVFVFDFDLGSIFDRFWIPVWFPKSHQHLLKSVQDRHQDRSQIGIPKKGPRELPKRPPGSSKRAPKRHQEAPKGTPREPQEPQESPKRPQESPKSPPWRIQDTPKSAPRGVVTHFKDRAS